MFLETIHLGVPHDPPQRAALGPDHARHRHRRRGGDRHGDARQRHDREGRSPTSPASAATCSWSGPARDPAGRTGADAKAFNIGDAEAIAEADRRRQGGGAGGLEADHRDRRQRELDNDADRHRRRLLRTRQWTLAAGRTFTESELRAGSAVCILGETVRKKLFGAGDPLGQTVRLQKISCDVIGCSRPRARRASARTRTTSS